MKIVSAVLASALLFGTLSEAAAGRIVPKAVSSWRNEGVSTVGKPAAQPDKPKKSEKPAGTQKQR